MKDDSASEPSCLEKSRRSFLKKAGTIVVAAPVMETLSREGIVVKSAHAQTLQLDELNGPGSGSIFDPAS